MMFNRGEKRVPIDKTNREHVDAYRFVVRNLTPISHHGNADDTCKRTTIISDRAYAHANKSRAEQELTLYSRAEV
jgi:hypothetical protein